MRMLMARLRCLVEWQPQKRWRQETFDCILRIPGGREAVVRNDMPL